jgi:ribosome-binding protein aMBF1 (putative translation factor)
MENDLSSEIQSLLGELRRRASWSEKDRADYIERKDAVVARLALDDGA